MEKPECTDRIVAGASELFRIYGTKAVTMDMLAQELGISKRTIYEKFKDKDELLHAVLKCMMQKQRDIMEAMINSEPNVLIAFLKHGKKMREHFNSMNPVLRSDLKRFHAEVVDKIKNSCGSTFENSLAFIKRGIEQGVLREDIDPDIVNRCLQGLGRMMGDPEIFPPDVFDQVSITKNVMVNYLRGIVTVEGLKVIEEYKNDF
ncbi:MAG TPA: TetR/AcrR family transcriptional regulator [Bacteroidales bacterium]|nr:TetR/AcrR family transcriptional regulator [Bacteroidales bacterium]